MKPRPVKIPRIFVKRLQALGPRFIRTAECAKGSIDKGWQKSENWMNADDPRLQDWLREGGNYGVACGFGLAVLDTDHPEIQKIVSTKFTPSLIVESLGHRSPHYYFISNLTGKMYLRASTGEHAGEILWEGFQALGPSSVHPNGGVYRIINDAPSPNLQGTAKGATWEPSSSRKRD